MEVASVCESVLSCTYESVHINGEWGTWCNIKTPCLHCLLDPHPPIQEVISLGCLPRLVQFLGDFSKAMLQVSFLAFSLTTMLIGPYMFYHDASSLRLLGC